MFGERGVILATAINVKDTDVLLFSTFSFIQHVLGIYPTDIFVEIDNHTIVAAA